MSSNKKKKPIKQDNSSKKKAKNEGKSAKNKDKKGTSQKKVKNKKSGAKKKAQNKSKGAKNSKKNDPFAMNSDDMKLNDDPLGILGDMNKAHDNVNNLIMEYGDIENIAKNAYDQNKLNK